MCLRKWPHLIVIGLILVTSYAGAQDSAYDDSILTQQACTFPCWYGLVPGETTLETARAILPTIPFVTLSNASITEGAGSPPDPLYYMGWHQGNAFVGLAFENGILSHMIVDPNLHYTLQDILTRYGPPDAWTSSQQRGSEVLYSYLESQLYYLNYGLIVQFTMYKGETTDTYYIRPEAEGAQFWLVPKPTTILQMLMKQWDISSEKATMWANEDLQYTWPSLYVKITLPPSFFLSGFHDVATIAPPSAATLTAIPTLALMPTLFPTATSIQTNTPS